MSTGHRDRRRRRLRRPRLTDRSICSSASTKRRSCSSTPTASAICRCARRRWSGISTRRPSPAATSSTTSATRTASRCATCSRRSSRTPTASIAATLDEIARYTKLFWINSGPYNNLTARKFVLTCTPAAFAAAAHAAAARRRALSAADRRDARRSCSRACSRCSSTPTSIRSSPARRRAPARTSSPPAPTTSTSA